MEAIQQKMKNCENQLEEKEVFLKKTVEKLQKIVN